MLLAIDTATRFASVALYDKGGVKAEQSWRSDNNHSVEVLPAIVRMLDQQASSARDLSGVAIAKGPGSFTGLRIGMAIAKGLCLALDLPIIAVPTLDIITYAVGDPGTPVWAVLEAGRGRICVAPYRFEDGLPVAAAETMLLRADEWQVEAETPVLIAGEVNAQLADHLLASPQADNIAISSLAGSVRRAGYLAEMAWYRLEYGTVDELDSLAPIYAHQPTSGN